MRPLEVVQSRKSGRWLWECRLCQAGEGRPRWHLAYDDARAHLRKHETFGFRAAAPGARGARGG